VAIALRAAELPVLRRVAQGTTGTVRPVPHLVGVLLAPPASIGTALRAQAPVPAVHRVSIGTAARA